MLLRIDDQISNQCPPFTKLILTVHKKVKNGLEINRSIRLYNPFSD